jgi:RNase P subunit RPR2
MRVKMQKARKEYKCYECGKIIKPGERYEYTVGVWDGDLSVFRTCAPCAAIWEEYFCGCRVFGELATYVSEDLGAELY